MNVQPAYEVHITDRGPASRPFGWEIQLGDSVLIERSTSTFATRGEAIADSTRAAGWSLERKENKPERAA